MVEELFFDLVSDLEGLKSRDEGNHALAKLKAEYDLSHVTYLGLNIPNIAQAGDGDIYFVSTYSDEWCTHYVSSNYVNIDPVIRNGIGGILPFDWSELRSLTALQKSFFGEASEFGVGRNGLSFPIRGQHGETALFSINSDCHDRDWKEIKKRCMRDFQIFAYHFHTRILESEGVVFEPAQLSPREVECLKWMASGKTRWETGAILNLSEHTIKLYIENARVKLGASNVTQAVAKAVARNLI